MASSRALAVVLGAVVLGFVLVQMARSPASAHVPHPGLDLYIAVEGVSDCDTSSGNGSCDLAPGTRFVIGVYLEALPADLPAYSGYDIAVRHTGVTANQDASTAAWPDCAFAAAAYDEEPQTETVVYGCAIGVPPAGPSSYTGLIGSSSFNCAASGSIEFLHGVGRTDLIDDSLQSHAEDEAARETLIINCTEGGITPLPVTAAPGVSTPFEEPGTPLPPTEAARATATAQSQATATAEAAAIAGTRTPRSVPPSDGDDGDGLDAWVIVLIVAGGIAGAGAVAGAGWWYLRRRGAGGPQRSS